MSENVLIKDKHILLCVGDMANSELDYLKNNFCGLVMSKLDGQTYKPKTIIYVCGNVDEAHIMIEKLDNNMIYVIVIKDLSTGYKNYNYQLIDLGKVPLNINNAGVYFRQLFSSEHKDYFNLISNEHQFQTLTESNKPTNAFRKGIYLTKVEHDVEANEVKFNLLRCSTNFVGSSDSFRTTDKLVINQVNNACKHFFEQNIELNHVLAQIYENTVVTDDKQNEKEKKATIKAHSDKTKDIPGNGLIAFCTFYQHYSDDKFDKNLSKYIKKGTNGDPFDYCYNEQSVLTRLHFRLKKDVNDPSLVKDFSVTLYPNSVFIIPLSTNRLYTHEIKPSGLPIDKLPTRMGYVMRCSKTKAVFRYGQTYINEDGEYIKLEQPTEKDIDELKAIYYRENLTSDIIHYGNVYFSLNTGDYKMPIV